MISLLVVKLNSFPPLVTYDLNNEKAKHSRLNKQEYDE